MASPRVSGTQSAEYKAFKSNFILTTMSIGTDLINFASRAFEKDLISLGNFEQVIEHGENAKTNLVLNLTKKIEVEKGVFEEILDILEDIPSLKSTKDRLKRARAKYTRSQSTDRTYSPPQQTHLAPPQTHDVLTQTHPAPTQTQSAGVTPNESQQGSEHQEQSIEPGAKIIGDLRQRTRENTRLIMTRYANYVSAIQESLKEKRITPSQLYSYLKSLPAFCKDDDGEEKPLLLSESSELKEAKTIDKICNILSEKYTSFLDYHIFQSILDKYGSNDKIVYLDYPRHLKEYVDGQKVENFEDLNPLIKKLPDELKKSIWKIDMEMTCGLDKIVNIQESVANILNMNTSILRIFDVKKGCVELTLLIPAHIADFVFTSGDIFTTEQIEQFQKLSIVWLQCNGYTYNFSEDFEHYQALLKETCMSPEYKAFRSNFRNITTAIGPELYTFARRTLEKNLISSESFKVVEGCKNAEYLLVLNLTQKLKEEKNNFKEILDILEGIPSLESIRLKLKEAYDHFSQIHVQTHPAPEQIHFAPAQTTDNTHSTPNPQQIHLALPKTHQTKDASTWTNLNELQQGTECPEQSIEPGAKIIGDLRQRTRENTRRIMTRYASYVSAIQESLEEKGITPSQLYRYLKSLPAFCEDDDGEEKPLLLSESRELKEATTIDEICYILSDKFTSFLDYHIFQSILDKYGSNEKTKNLDYPRHLKEYVEGQTLKKFVDLNPLIKNFKLSDESKQIILKIDTEMTCRLGKIVELKASLANILDIERSTLRIIDIRNGCVELTLLIPAHIADFVFTSDNIFTSEQIEQFQKLSILWLKCNGYIYNFSQVILDFESFNAFLKKILIQSSKKGSPLHPDETLSVSKTLHSLRTHFINTYDDVLITILVYPFQSDCKDNLISLRHITSDDLQQLHHSFFEERENFNKLFKKGKFHDLQVYLLKLAIGICSETRQLLETIVQMMSTLEPPLQKEVLDLYKLCHVPQEFEHRLDSWFKFTI